MHFMGYSEAFHALGNAASCVMPKCMFSGKATVATASGWNLRFTMGATA